MAAQETFSATMLLAQAQALRQEQQAEQSEETLDWVVFRLGQERYALPTAAVRAVVRCGPITPLPATPRHLLGLTNLRGEVLSVLDFRPLLGLPATQAPQFLIVCQLGEHSLAVAADSCPELVQVPAAKLEHAVGRTSGASYVAGQISDDQGLVFMLDPTPVFET